MTQLAILIGSHGEIPADATEGVSPSEFPKGRLPPHVCALPIFQDDLSATRAKPRFGLIQLLPVYLHHDLDSVINSPGCLFSAQITELKENVDFIDARTAVIEVIRKHVRSQPGCRRH